MIYLLTKDMYEYDGIEKEVVTEIEKEKKEEGRFSR